VSLAAALNPGTIDDELHLLSYTPILLVTLLFVCCHFSSLSSEKEAERIKQRLAQQEAEAIEMEMEEENKMDHANHEKEVCDE